MRTCQLNEVKGIKLSNAYYTILITQKLRVENRHFEPKTTDFLRFNHQIRFIKIKSNQIWNNT